MMEYPLISISVLVFNTDRLMLKEMIESVFKQDYPNYEFVIIDNNSNKETKRNLHEIIQDRNVRIIVNKENVGVHNGRIQMIQESRGDYIAMIDHDDVLPTNYLSILFSGLNKANTKNVVVKGGYISFKNNCKFDNSSLFSSTYYSKFESLKILFSDKLTYPWATLFPKKIFDGLVLSEEKGVDDAEINFFALKKADGLVIVDKQIYGYRFTPNSAMKNDHFLHLAKRTFEVWLDYSRDSLPEMIDFLSYRLSLANIKCKIVDFYQHERWSDFVEELKKDLSTIKDYYPKVRPELKRRKRIEVLVLLNLTHIYCSLYYFHRRKIFK